jgi:DHA2 family multidrug resistance protein
VTALAPRRDAALPDGASEAPPVKLRVVPPAPKATAHPPRVGGRQLLGYLGMVLGMFMAILDIQIVSSSISEIQAGVSASADEIAWVQTAYLIAEVVMIPLSGYLSRAFSTRILFVASALSFTVASIACAMATDLETLIVARAAQGFLGGAMIPTVFATSFTIFPPQQRAASTVMVGLVATLAPTIGPTVGGWLTETFSWHWLFLMNVGPGILVTLLVWSFIDIDKPNLSLLKGFDAIGLALMAVFLGCLEYVVEEGPRWNWFDDETIFTLAIIATFAGVAFFARVLSYRNPIVDLSAFANRNFASGSLLGFVMGIGLYGLVYLLPLYLAQVRGLNALQIGEIMFVTGLAQFISAPVSGILVRKIDPRLMLGLGFAMIAVSTWSLAGLTADWDFWELFVPQILRGAGLMFAMIPITTLALGTLPPQHLKSASGLFNLMRNLGGAFGLAGINTVINDQRALHWSRLAEHINPGRPEVQAYIDNLTARFGTLVAGDPAAVANRRLAAMVMRQAMVLTFIDCFVIMSAIFVGAMLVMPLIRRPATPAGAGGGGH